MELVVIYLVLAIVFYPLALKMHFDNRGIAIPLKSWYIGFVLYLFMWVLVLPAITVMHLTKEKEDGRDSNP